MNSNIIELSPSEVGTLFTFINKTLDAHELTQGFKYGGLTGMKGIYDGLLRCKILTDANPSLYTQSKYLSPDFGAGILTK
jgi:hypothetical protein